ncbi:MAG: beta-hydroxyacyl-ACP dehydratase [Planctomycetota bacterium]
MWIDRVVELVPRERLVAIKHISLAEEHLHDHFPAHGDTPALPVMPGSLIIEGCAQSAGILVGHAEQFREKVILAKIAKATLGGDAMPGDTLRYTATASQISERGASTHIAIERLDPAEPDAGYGSFGEIEMMFSHLDQNMAGREFPEHNFVFGEGFKTLLRSSGIDF